MAVACDPRSVLICSMSLLASLKEYRQLRSVKDQIPLYCVFGDTVIKSLAERRPNTSAAFQDVRGFTQDKVQRYGDDVLRLIRGAKPDRQVRKAAPMVLVQHTRRVSPLDPFTRRRALLKTYEASAAKRMPGIPANKAGVYVLELSQGRVYVGHSSDVKRRIQQHMSGQGSAFTKAFPPTGVLLPRLGRVTGSAEAAERDETLRYMFLRGMQLVRGWRYVRVDLPQEDLDDAERNIRELYDLCRRCGHPGHFITGCKASFDRLGKPC
jgi:predicted GIY-YIG superfamily endonuclease